MSVLRLGKRDSNTHCLTMDVFAIFQLVGFDRRQACLHPPALKSCEKHLSVRCEQFNIRDFCRYKENTAENTCRIFKVFDAITAKISMLNQYGFGSRLPNSEGMCVFFILRRRVQRYCTAVRGGKNKKHIHSRDNIACASKI